MQGKSSLSIVLDERHFGSTMKVNGTRKENTPEWQNESFNTDDTLLTLCEFFSHNLSHEAFVLSCESSGREKRVGKWKILESAERFWFMKSSESRGDDTFSDKTRMHRWARKNEMEY